MIRWERCWGREIVVREVTGIVSHVFRSPRYCRCATSRAHLACLAIIQGRRAEATGTAHACFAVLLPVTTSACVRVCVCHARCPARFPFGGVGIITPFNFPLEICALQLMGALYMGNRPVIKVRPPCPRPRLPCCAGLRFAVAALSDGLQGHGGA